MYNDEKNKRRITVEIDDPDLRADIQQLIPWGSMKPLINTIMKDVVALMKKHDSRIVLGAILSEDIVLKDYLGKLEQIKDVKHTRLKGEHYGETEEGSSERDS